jgi:glycosyltransferase involved in cell wall biosynthesis
MDDCMTISIVINNYNYQKYITQAINSALQQTLPAHEIIVVDDGSTDQSIALIESQFGAKVKLIKSANYGQLNAIKLGVEHSSGDYIAFLDADDEYKPQHLKECAEFIKNNPDADFIISNCELIGEAHGIWFSNKETIDYGMTTLAGITREGIGAPTSCLIIKKDKLNFLNDLTADMIAKWRIRADDVLIYGASIYGSHKFRLAQPTVDYRIHHNNNFYGHTTSHKKSAQYNQQRQELLQELIKCRFHHLTLIEIIDQELAKNTFRKIRHKRNILITILKQNASIMQKIGLIIRTLIQ